MVSTTLKKDPSPATTPDPAVEIRTDMWNLLVDILNGHASEYANVVAQQSTKTGSYTITQDDFCILADATSSGFTVTLPTAGGTGITKKIVAIKKIDSSANKVTIDGNAAETIDGKTTIDLETENEILLLQSDGTNWRILANYLAVIDNGLLKIRNPAGTFNVSIKTSAILANRSATIPLITADDTFVMVNLAQSLRSKTLVDANGNEVLITGSVGSAVNEVTITNAATGNGPTVAATGDDANIDLNINGKGTGYPRLVNLIATNIREATGKAIAIAITALASAVNYVEIKANITANDPEIEAKGSDTNVGLTLKTKGNGTVKLPNSDLQGNDLDNIQNLINDLSTATSALDFAGDEFQTISISANTTFTGTGYATGKKKSLRIICDGTLRTLSFPAGWKFMNNTKPTDIAASKTGVLVLQCYGATESDVVAAYTVEA